MKSQLMKIAHKFAKLMVIRTKDYHIALSFGMKFAHAGMTMSEFSDLMAETLEVYNQTVSPVKEVEMKGNKAPEWLLRKNLTSNEFYAVNNECYSTEIARETAKAVLFKFDTAYGVVNMWCPKSVLVA